MSILSPVVRFRRGTIEPLFDSTEAGRRSFSQTAYRIGRRYDVVNQGVRVGSAVVRGDFPPECGVDTVAWKGKVVIDPAILMRDTTLRLVAVEPGTIVGNQPAFRASAGKELERLQRAASDREEILLLHDVIDLDGDSVPELVAEARVYEGMRYQIYGRRDGRWSALYESRYSGC